MTRRSILAYTYAKAARALLRGELARARQWIAAFKYALQLTA